jgi:hypothetical protein
MKTPRRGFESPRLHCTLRALTPCYEMSYFLGCCPSSSSGARIVHIFHLEGPYRRPLRSVWSGDLPLSWHRYSGSYQVYYGGPGFLEPVGSTSLMYCTVGSTLSATTAPVSRMNQPHVRTARQHRVLQVAAHRIAFFRRRRSVIVGISFIGFRS